MEYKDYKTGELMSREQYIISGLERGELLVKEECGCVVIQDRTAEAYIVYCLKHESAPDLYEAVRQSLNFMVDIHKLLMANPDYIEGAKKLNATLWQAWDRTQDKSVKVEGK